ncbi:MAG: hypothetical protein Q8O03_03505 [Nanoarchaeota archaeon]|jgi:hypothetical protein|nr:hypothetical protein [Nanoarchaeota archaeon]
MSQISKKKVDKIKEDVLSVLFESGLRGMFTKQISDEIARNDEFVLKLLLDLEKQNVVKQIRNTKKGTQFIRRKQWTMTDKAYETYKGLL